MKLLWQLMSVYAASRVRKKNNFKAEDASGVKEGAGDLEEIADDVEEDASNVAKDDSGG